MRHHPFLDVTASARTFENPRVQTDGSPSPNREGEPTPTTPPPGRERKMRMARVLSYNMRTFIDQTSKRDSIDGKKETMVRQAL